MNPEAGMAFGQSTPGGFGLSWPDSTHRLNRGYEPPRSAPASAEGSLEGAWAVDVSGNWRVVFRFEGKDAVDVDYVDYH